MRSARGGRVPGMAGIELRAVEEHVYEGHPSWRALMSFYLAGLLVAAAVFVIVGLLLDEMAIGVIAGIALAALTLLVGYFRRVATTYLITNQRLRISRGVVRRQVQETRLDRVQNVNFSQGALDRMLKVGSVDFDTAGTDDSEFRFEWVNDPEGVVRSVNDAIHERDTLRAQHQPGAPG
jgi:uncharacterized membrane protein YdbT with pleckstrin-like domain